MAGKKGASGRPPSPGKVYQFNFYYRFAPGEDPSELETLLESIVQTNGRKRRDILRAALLGGPYQFVRHSGYVGAILYQLATPFLLGSWWAFIPMILSVPFLVVRTALEDKLLQQNLDGYQAYARQVRYRLLLGVW